jgi:integrase
LATIREAQTRETDFVFEGRYGRDHRRSIKRNWEAILKAANIEGLRLHDLRHSCASQLVSSDERFPDGARLAVDLMFADGNPVPCGARRWRGL